MLRVVLKSGYIIDFEETGRECQQNLFDKLLKGMESPGQINFSNVHVIKMDEVAYAGIVDSSTEGGTGD